MRAFFCGKIPEKNQSAELSQEEKKHLFNVLRAKDGDEVLLLDGKGKTALAKIAKDERILVENIEKHKAPEKKITLFVAPPRQSGMDQIIAYACQTAVSKVVPIICKNSVALPNKSEKWQKKIIESCKQSQNPFFPEIIPPLSLNEAILYAKDSTIFFGSAEGQNTEIKYPLLSQISWFVGPEGGFSGEEIQKLINAGAMPLKLSPYILRIETAALSGIIMLCNLESYNSGKFIFLSQSPRSRREY